MKEKFDIPVGPIKLFFVVRNRNSREPQFFQSIIGQVRVHFHPESGYFVETNQNPLKY